MDDFAPIVARKLAAHGWTFKRRGKGSHAIWHDPKSGRTTVVPDKIKSRHTANGILKDAGVADRIP